MTGKRRSEWTTALELGSPTRADAAVHGKNHPRSIAGTVGGKERHQVGDFPRVGGPLQRKTLLQLPVAIFIAKLVLRPGLHQRDVAVGADWARIDADDADV